MSYLIIAGKHVDDGVCLWGGGIARDDDGD